MKNKEFWIVWALCAAIFFVVCLLIQFADAGDRTLIKRYDSRWNLEGYSVREGNRETVYDRNWSRKGYRIYEGDREEKFDTHWNREGTDIESDDREKED